MKKIVLGFALLAVGCSNQSITGPSSTQPASSQTVVAAGANTPQQESSNDSDGIDADAPTAGASPTIRYAMDGPRGCVSAAADTMRWNLAVSDAGPSHVRFVALSHQSPDPGCASTVEEPRARVTVTGDVNYAPHAVGRTVFTFDPTVYSCGRVQVDVSAFDATGHETLLVGMVVDYGTVCAPPPPPPPSEARLLCAPQVQRTAVNELARVTAEGGNGIFGWHAPAGSPETGATATFSTMYPSAGTHEVTVASGNQQATCTVVVEPTPPPPPPPPALACTPASQGVMTSEPAVLTATGGAGSYAWAAATGSPAAGQSATFTTTFQHGGTHSVTVSSGGSVATCTVTVSAPPPPPALVCAPAAQTVALNQPAVLTASGGTGSYSWAATAGGPVSGQQATFTTTFQQGGTHAVSVSSGSASQTCTVTVTAPPPPICSDVNPPSFTTSFPIISGNSLGATATVKNEGNWAVHLYATSTYQEYESNRPDYEKAVEARTLACGENSTLTLKYVWSGHPSKYWWLVVKRNGRTMYKSAAAINPTAR